MSELVDCSFGVQAKLREDELVEVTPKSIRLRKAILDPHERKKARWAKSAAA